MFFFPRLLLCFFFPLMRCRRWGKNCIAFKPMWCEVHTVNCIKNQLKKTSRKKANIDERRNEIVIFQAFSCSKCVSREAFIHESCNLYSVREIYFWKLLRVHKATSSVIVHNKNREQWRDRKNNTQTYKVEYNCS